MTTILNRLPGKNKHRNKSVVGGCRLVPSEAFRERIGRFRSNSEVTESEQSARCILSIRSPVRDRFAPSTMHIFRTIFSLWVESAPSRLLKSVLKMQSASCSANRRHLLRQHGCVSSASQRNRDCSRSQVDSTLVRVENENGTIRARFQPSRCECKRMT